MQSRPRTAASKKRRVKIKKDRRDSKIKNLGIPIGAKTTRATR